MAIYDLNLSNVSKITGGYGHSLAVTSDGKLYSWGLNNNYQLGNGNNITSSTPTQVGNDSDWVDVACGDYHSIAIKTNGKAYSWGRNVENQCGLSGVPYITRPTGVTIPDNTAVIDKVAASKNYTLFGDTSTLRRVYGTGQNNFLVLNNSSSTNYVTPTRMTDFDNAFIIAAGPQLCGAVIGADIKVRGVLDFFTNNGAGPTYYLPTQTSASLVPGSNSALSYTSLVIGYDFLLALKQDGSLWGYTFYDPDFSISATPAYPNSSTIGFYGYEIYAGYAQSNKLVLINNSKFWTRIACGQNHAILTDINNNIYSFGSDTYGQLGRTTTGNDTNIVQMSGTAATGSWNAIGCSYYSSLMCKGQ